MQAFPLGYLDLYQYQGADVDEPHIYIHSEMWNRKVFQSAVCGGGTVCVTAVYIFTS